jgi:putative hydrolase of the HAD superfamily
MTLPGTSAIRAIVFDLDGTLYVSDEFAATIQDRAAGYVAGLLGVSVAEACLMISATRLRLAEEQGASQTTLSAASNVLGGTTPALHDYFQAHLHPESFLKRDERVVGLIERLGRRFPLYIYTNNNRPLTERILHLIGLDGCFKAIYSIDETWQAKPDEDRLDQILRAVGFTPGEVLFVGDRYEVDLRVPEQKGCPIYLSQSVEQLLRLEELIVGNAK